MTVSSGRLAGVPDMETMMGPTMTTVPMCMDLSVTSTVGAALTSMRDMLYSGVPYEPLASESTTQHFGTAQRETLLNCAEVPESEDLVISGKSGSLRFRPEKNGSLYGKMSVLMNMRVAREGNDVRLRAVFENSSLSKTIVEDALGRFANCLQEVSRANDDEYLANLRDAVRSNLHDK